MHLDVGRGAWGVRGDELTPAWSGAPCPFNVHGEGKGGEFTKTHIVPKCYNDI